MLVSSWRSWIMDITDKRRNSWFLVIWKTIWRLWWGDSLGGRPNHTLLRGVFRFLSCLRVPLGMLVMVVISDKEYRPPSINPNALLRRLGVQWGVFMMWLINYERIEALLIVVVVVAAFVMMVVSSVIVMGLEISADHCRIFDENRLQGWVVCM